MSDLVRKAGILSAADFTRLAVKTLIGIVLARVLTQTEYGTYRQLFMIYTLMSSIFMIGLPQSVYYFVPKSEPTLQRKFLRQTLDVFTILGLLCSLILLLFRYDLARMFNNQDLTKTLLIYAFYPFFMFISQLYYIAMIGLQQTRNAAGFTIFSVICDLLFILGIAIATKNMTYVVAGIMLSVFIQWLYARIKLRPYTRVENKQIYDLVLLKQQFTFSLPIGISSIIGVVTAQLDKIVISSFFSPQQFAVFAVGAAELPFIFIISNSVNSVILPAMNQSSDRNQISALFNGAVRKNALILFPLFVFCFVFAPHIISLLYSDKYSSAVVFFRIYLLSMPMRIATYSILFQVCNKNKYIFTISGLILVLNVFLSILLIHIVGMKGPAISTITVTFLSVVMYLILIRNRLKYSLSSIFPIKALVLTMLSSLTAGVVCILIIFLPVRLPIQLLVGALIFPIVYFIFGIKFKAILDYDVSLLRNLFYESSKKLTQTLKHAR
jgi:O-antigen/teichoic acid export membrane protein